MRRARPVAGALAWAVAGLGWSLSMFLPWTTSGPLSSASLMDAVELLRRGVGAGVVPGWAAPLLCAPGVAGICVLGLAGFSGPLVAAARTLSAAFGAVCVLAIAARLTHGDVGDAGPGVAAGLVGLVAVGVATALQWVGRSS